MINYDDRTILESLRKGNVPNYGINKFYITNEKVVSALKEDLDYVKNNGYKTKYICGAYGSGKSLSLCYARDMSLENQYVTSYVVLDPRTVTFHKMEVVYNSIMKNLLINTRGTLQFGAQALFYILSMWYEEHLFGNRISTDPIIIPELPTFDSLVEMCVKERKIRPYILNWLMGEKRVPFQLKRIFGVKGDVDRTMCMNLLKVFSKIMKHIGFNGWTILLDEAESIMDLYSRKARAVAYDNMRNIDENRDGISSLYIMYAGTPEFFIDTEIGVASYAALNQRISSNLREGASYREPILWLENMKPDQYSIMLNKIQKLYMSAYGISSINKKHVSDSIKKITKTERNPRDIIREYINFLDNETS